MSEKDPYAQRKKARSPEKVPDAGSDDSLLDVKPRLANHKVKKAYKKE